MLCFWLQKIISCWWDDSEIKFLKTSFVAKLDEHTCPTYTKFPTLKFQRLSIDCECIQQYLTRDKYNCKSKPRIIACFLLKKNYKTMLASLIININHSLSMKFSFFCLIVYSRKIWVFICRIIRLDINRQHFYVNAIHLLARCPQCIKLNIQIVNLVFSDNFI